MLYYQGNSEENEEEGTIEKKCQSLFKKVVRTYFSKRKKPKQKTRSISAEINLVSENFFKIQLFRSIVLLCIHIP
jgi:hypothetical protein